MSRCLAGLEFVLREGLPQEKLVALRQCLERVSIDKPSSKITVAVWMAFSVTTSVMTLDGSKNRNKSANHKLQKLRNLFLGLLSLGANIDCSGMTVALDSFIHLEEIRGNGKFPEFAESVVARVEFWGLLGDTTARNTQMSPPTIVGTRLKSTSEKSYQFGISLEFISCFGFDR